MDTAEYKSRKLDKITRDIVREVNSIPTFGYGDNIDNIAKLTLTNFLLSLTTISDIRENDIDVISQSILDELEGLSSKIVSELLELSRVQ